MINLQHVDSSMNYRTDPNLGVPPPPKFREYFRGPLDYDFKRKHRKMRNSVNEILKSWIVVVLNPGCMVEISGEIFLNS